VGGIAAADMLPDRDIVAFEQVGDIAKAIGAHNNGIDELGHGGSKCKVVP
jgi:hypothetical protein